MFWLILLVPLALIILLAVWMDRKNKKKGLESKVNHEDVKYLCMQKPPEVSRSTK